MDAAVVSKYMSDFIEDGYIASGGYGVVVKCTNIIDEQKYVAKKISVEASSLGYDGVLREAKVMALMNHTNVVRYHHSWLEAEMSGNTGELIFQSDIKSRCLYILMEKCDGKERVRYLLDHGHTIRMFKDCVAGVAHIHSKGYLHCDLAPPNIFVKRAPPSFTLKVGDFGLARPMGSETSILISKSPGHPTYRAPEYIDMWNSRMVRVGLKSDIFSLGVILAQPLHPESKREVFQHHRLQPMPSQWKEDSYGPLLARLLSHNPDELPTAAQLFQELDT